VTAATESHHIAKIADRPDLRLDPANLMALCQSCHAIRTGRGE
jgi:5-methylcytosine-specific restriction endonuclease McrA